MRLAVEHDLLRDTLEVTVVGNDNNRYTLMYMKEDLSGWEQSLDIQVGADEIAFQESIESYYTSRFGISPKVTMTTT